MKIAKGFSFFLLAEEIKIQSTKTHCSSFLFCSSDFGERKEGMLLLLVDFLLQDLTACKFFWLALQKKCCSYSLKLCVFVVSNPVHIFFIENIINNTYNMYEKGTVCISIDVQ